MDNIPFVFLINKGFRGTMWDRGGTQYAIQAFLSEFTSKDNVTLLIKINPSYGIPDMKKTIEQLKPKNKDDFAPIKVNHDNIPYKKLSKFYHQGDIIVSPTRAEAFNLPLIEGMACGLPSITTNYGGQTDFVNEKNGWLIDYILKDVKEDVVYESIRWAVPDIEDLKKIMRYCFEHQDEVKEKGQQALKDVQNWTWNISARKALDFLKELE